MKLFLSFLFLISFDICEASSPFANIDSIKSSLGFTKFYSQARTGRTLKIAVLDKGFNGFEKEIGRTLPSNTRYVAGPIKTPENMAVEHGLKMAQILTSLMTNDMKNAQWMPELTLYNVFGFSNFKAAIDDIIARKVDLVLYSEVWEYGGNFNGAGFINAEVSRATQQGVVWVNAAGNFALTTFNAGLKTATDNWVQLPDQNNSLAIRCDGKQVKKCSVKIVLSWNDFKEDVEQGTNKDLDLALTDDLLNIIQSSGLRQSADPRENRPGFSKYPREIITAELDPGLYYVRVKNRSLNFTAADSLRVTVDGDGIIMPSHTWGESLLNPADNPSVITVGASDSIRSSTSQYLNKPDLLTVSSLVLNNKMEFRGSSNSAAIVAAGLALLKSQNPTLTKAQLLKMVSFGSSWESKGISLNLLGFQPTGPGCFENIEYKPVPAFLQEVVNKGGVIVRTTAGARVMVPFDPIMLAPQLRRQLLNDMIVALPQGGYAIFPRRSSIPARSAEIFQRPLEAGLCRPHPSTGKMFRL